MSHSANSHWILQRLSAVALIPLSLFSTYKILNLFNGGESFLSLFHSPFSLFCIILFVFFGLYHASMGLEVIAEDYIPNNCSQKTIVGMLKFVNIVTFAFLIFAVIIGFNKLNIENYDTTQTQNSEENSVNQIEEKN